MSLQKFKRHQSEAIGGQVRVQTLEEWATADLKSSGINDGMIALNFQVVEGDSVIEILSEHAIAEVQRVNSYATKPAQRILDRYQFAAQGGWIALADQNNVAYFKPRYPRSSKSQGFGTDKGKAIKYETPAKREALPLFPFVDLETADRIYQKYNAEPLEGESFWSCVRRCNLPICVTEGYKKAVLLTQQGYPAICLRGVANWHSKDSRVLFLCLREFATEGRKIRIVFDQDEKPKTIANVAIQIRQLGKAFEQLGSKVSVTTWDSASGKGIDDAFLREGADWLDRTIAVSFSLDEWQKCGLKRQYFEIIRRLKTLALTPDRDTQGDCYLSGLPPETPIGSITLIQANMDAGKSYSGIDPVVRRWIENGGNVLRLDPLLSLGAQGAKLSNIVHSSEYDLSDTEGYRLFCRDISARHGAAVCFNSLPKIPNWFLTERPLLLVLDEVNQGLDYLIKGKTLANRHGEILDKFSEILFICQFNGAVIAAEAEIHPRSLKLLKAYSGADNVRYFKHYRDNAPWQVTIGSGDLSGFASTLIGDSRKLIMTDSQASGKRLERFLRSGGVIEENADDYFADPDQWLENNHLDRKIVRIDSETNRGGKFAKFFDNPDKWLEDNQPDILICSPTVKTGVSITWKGFDAVYGYFLGATEPDGWMQMLGRYRPTVPRFVCCPKFVLTQGDESLLSTSAINKHGKAERQFIAADYAIEALAETDERKQRVLLAAQEYYADMSILRGAQNAISREYLILVLEAAGHSIEIREWGKDPAVQVRLTEIQDGIDHEDADLFADSPLCDSVDDALKILASDCSLEDERMALKTLHRESFPGISFDDQKDCYWILTRNRGNIGRGAQTQAAIENIAAIKELEREQVEAICSDELGMSHRISKRSIKSRLLQQSGILQLAYRGVQFFNSDPRSIAIQRWAVKFSKELRYYFGLQVKEQYIDANGRKRHTPVEICNKLLKKIGFKAVVEETEGGRGSQERIYTIEIDRVKAPSVPLEKGASKEERAAANKEATEKLQDEAWAMRDRALAAAQERLRLVAEPEKPRSTTQQNCFEAAQSQSSEVPSLNSYEFSEPLESDDDDDDEVAA
ncbi:MAG: DUF3854 domain-containing protein [Plectolyngbya sp. WJT66-NPBG17]|jgi:hypothetical protein|nr:DUF3854 domain-containing protein [Plectolyngbya sp. WJT66-NPBG17]